MPPQSTENPDGPAPIDSYDLVVVGAGIAGLNALSAASEYLPRTARVLLVDQKAAPGGMWNTAYDYVRLHQPHPMFTVGNMTWGWDKPRDYLAARDEVQQHLARALDPIRARVTLDTAFEHQVTHCAEDETPYGPLAKLHLHPNTAQEASRTVHATRAIDASGLNYAPADPLPLSARNVVSIIPQDLRPTLQDHPGAPVYVVGGGKTGMDTILATQAADPSRRIALINGRGTLFLNRTHCMPTGLRRWTSGTLFSEIFRDIALNFDGDNETHTLAHLRSRYSTTPHGDGGAFLYGFQSEDERAQIDAALSETIADYLSDITDSADGPRMQMRSGAEIAIPPGSIIVNCSGSFFRDAPWQKATPTLSPAGIVLSMNARDASHFLSSVGGFLATHLWYRERLRGQGIYTVDLEALFRKNRDAWVGATSALAYMNQVIAMQNLPLSVLNRCGLDMDRWYPLPRRIAGLVRLRARAKQDIAHCRRVLDRVGQRFDIHAGPLE